MRRWLLSWLMAALAPAPVTSKLELAAGTLLEARLTTRVASTVSKPGDAVEAVVIAPVPPEGEVVVLPAGAKLRGTVKDVRPIGPAQPRSVLELEFKELELPGGDKVAITCQVVAVDNAREEVDAAGRILGIAGSQTISSRLDQGLDKLGKRFAGFASVLEATKSAMLADTDPEIQYPAGVELTVKLAARAAWESAGPPVTSPRPESVRPADELAALVNRLPFQTFAEKPPKPSDITTLMFLGTREQLESAFTAAGWTTAAALSGKSKLETFRAVAEARGYSEAPMSVLLLEGVAPDLMLQKQNNTFSRRHHLRIWRRADLFQGRTVWVSSATHDIGIDFSAENRTFIHKIDPNIDRERAKVVTDLGYAGRIAGLSLVERAAVPKEGMNATGDKLITDGRMAVIQLK
jgi:hypothetical protein